MTATDFDLITVGGGLAGAALAKLLAEDGRRVLVLERETVFKDRVRGEQVLCWGVAEARKLGLYDVLKAAGAIDLPHWRNQMFGAPPAPARDLAATTANGCGGLNFFHPTMQEALLHGAEAAGAVVRRGVRVTGIAPGGTPTVTVEGDGGERRYGARLVAGADGRNSQCRKWAGFEVRRDSDHTVLAGVLLDGMGAPEDTLTLFMHPGLGQVALAVPLGERRFRTYIGAFHDGRAPRWSGAQALPDFIRTSVATGTPAEWFNGVAMAGPLASFEGADSWVDHPYRDGVVLIGDAAAASDPSFGCGLSLTLRDVRVLSERLRGQEDWRAAADAYATEHDRHYGVLHRIHDWLRTMFIDNRPQADAARARAMPRFAEDPTRVVDIVGLGPDAPSDEAARRRFFGED